MARDVAHAREIACAYLADGVPALVEERVPLRRELSALVARSPFGQGAAWPVVETVQADGICVLVIAPAPELPEELAAEAQGLALRLAADSASSVCSRSSYSRPPTANCWSTNWRCVRTTPATGPWTGTTSQFEQHLRAVLDYPLGDTDAIAPTTVMANVLGAPQQPAVTPMSLDERLHHLFARMPDARVHLYGKEERPGRKIGHINFWAPTPTAWPNCVNAPSWRHTGCHTDSGRTDGIPMAEQPEQPRVGVIMGSDSDWSVMQDAARALAEFDVPTEVRVVSAHRTPAVMFDYARGAADRGIEVIIAGAGGAAHLPGMVAAATPLPVIGVPVPLARLDGLDSLLSIVQMPAGVPVATVSIGGARNAGLLAVRILGCADAQLRARLVAFSDQLAETVRAKDAALQELHGKVTGQ